MTYNEIIAETEQLNQENFETVDQVLGKWSTSQWSWTPEPTRWSAFQCLAHLNQVNTLYIDQLEALVPKLKRAEGSTQMRSGFMGARLIKTVKKRNNNIKAPKFLQPQATATNYEAVETYKKNNRRLQQILPSLKDKDLYHPKVVSTAGKIFQPRIGDVLQMMIHHDKRHIEQALRIKSFEGFPNS